MKYQKNIIRDRYDVIVIGSGIAGLVCAAHLSHAGLKVLLLEQHTVPGGMTSIFKRKEFIFEAGGHRVTGIKREGGPLYEVLKKIGRKIPFTTINPSYIVQAPGLRLEGDLDQKKYRENLVELFPDQRSAIDTFLKDMKVIAQAREYIDSFEDEPDPGILSSHFPLYARYAGSTTHDFIAGRFSNPGIIPLVTMPGVYSTHPLEEQSFVFFARSWAAHHSGEGMSVIEGGTRTLIDALIEYIDTNGGQVVVSKMATRILVEDGSAFGVLTRDGEEVMASAVVSAASDEQTFLKLLVPEKLPSGFIEHIKQKRPSGSLFQVYLGIKELDGTGLENVTNFSVANLEPLLRRRGPWDIEAITAAGSISIQGKEMAPDGYRAINISCPCPYEHPDNWFIQGDDKEEYRGLKENIARKIIRNMAQFIPDLEERIFCMETATPLTIERYTLATAGGIHGLANTVELSGLDRGSIKTPVKHLYHVGQYVYPGGAIVAAAQSGKQGARTVLRELL